jgi:hypothetical protein
MLSEPIQVDLGGQAYKCCYLTQKIQGDWERWVERHELGLLRESQAELTIDEFDRALSTHRFKSKNHGYELGTSENERWMRTKEGFKYLMWQCFTQAGSAVLEDEMAALIDGHPAEFKELWGQLVEEYLDSIGKKEIPGS